MTATHRKLVLLFATLTLVCAACSPQADQAAPTTEDATPVAAFSGVKKATKAAAGWREDAELYAIASPAPQVDEAGRSPAWLYTYVSESSGTVASVTVADGEAKLAPEQELPDGQIRDISKNTLPPPAELQDSSEAIKDAEKVREVLEDEGDAEVTAGLDSFSSESAVWIFSTVQGEERVEQKVPAS